MWVWKGSPEGQDPAPGVVVVGHGNLGLQAGLAVVLPDLNGVIAGQAHHPAGTCANREIHQCKRYEFPSFAAVLGACCLVKNMLTKTQCLLAVLNATANSMPRLQDDPGFLKREGG